ncbi:MAG: adenylyl-sulfate kinase [Rhizobacter sp.]|nr:adenylyl-sulfate kinase [Rhizobacter sp.]
MPAMLRSPSSRALTLWFTGLSGAGKSTLARALEKSLREQGHSVLVLDGDEVRRGLNRDLGFSPSDRHENVRRVAEVARLANAAGITVLAALIAPLREQRHMAREIIGTEAYLEIYVSTPLAVCVARDTKGLYARAKAGALQDLTGVGAAYEAPEQPQAAIDTATVPLPRAVDELVALMASRTRA